MTSPLQLARSITVKRFLWCILSPESDKGCNIDPYGQYIVGVRVYIHCESEFHVAGLLGVYTSGEYGFRDTADVTVCKVDRETGNLKRNKYTYTEWNVRLWRIRLSWYCWYHCMQGWWGNRNPEVKQVYIYIMECQPVENTASVILHISLYSRLMGKPETEAKQVHIYSMGVNTGGEYGFRDTADITVCKVDGETGILKWNKYTYT